MPVKPQSSSNLRPVLRGLTPKPLVLRHNQLLPVRFIIHKLPLTNVLLLSPARRPHLVAESAPLLPLGMLVMARRVETGVELAGDVDMHKFASFPSAIGTVPAHSHGWMAVWAIRVGAVREEFAILLGLIHGFLRW